MKVLLVYHELSYRGGERIFTNLGKGLVDNGNEVFLIAGRVLENTNPIPQAIKIIRPWGLINTFFRNNWVYVFLSIPLTFFNIVYTGLKADVIYTGETYLALWPAVLASKLLRKNLVLIAFEMGSKKTHPIDRLFIKTVKSAITINRTLLPILKKEFNIKKVSYAPAGIDYELFKNPNAKRIIKKYNLQGKRIILMAGSVHPAKKQDLALYILAEVKQFIPNITLLVVGKENKTYLKKLKSLAETLEVQTEVIFTGFVPEEDLKHYYHAADLVLMCGPVGGLTILEAIIMGKMPIYPSSGNLPHGPAEPLNLGLIVKNGKINKYREKIVNYLKYPKRYTNKLKRDHKIVLKKYSLENFSDQALKILYS